LSSLILIIKDLQYLILSLEYQSSNHAYLEITLDPSFPGPNHDIFIACDQDLGCKEDHDDIMMLNDQPSSKISNTILEPNKQTQLQDHSSTQIFHSCTYRDEVDFAKEDIDLDLLYPLYEKVIFNDVTYERSNQDNEVSYAFIDTCDESSSKYSHNDN
jgi:hypothetical protein